MTNTKDVQDPTVADDATTTSPAPKKPRTTKKATASKPASPKAAEPKNTATKDSKTAPKNAPESGSETTDGATPKSKPAKPAAAAKSKVAKTTKSTAKATESTEKANIEAVPPIESQKPKAPAKPTARKTAAKSVAAPKKVEAKSAIQEADTDKGTTKAAASTPKPKKAPAKAKKSSAPAEKASLPVTEALDAPKAATPTQAPTAEPTVPTEAIAEKAVKPQGKRPQQNTRKPKAIANDKQASSTDAPEQTTAPASATEISHGYLTDSAEQPTAAHPAPELAAESSAEGSTDESQAPSEKKKRSRSRGGRGRKKNGTKTAETNGEGSVATETDEQIAATEENKKPEHGKKGNNQRQARRKMFVSVVPEEQVEVVITEEGQVQEYYVEMVHQLKTKGNIYKGVIHNVDPNLQAAFVSYGAVKNGFLQIDEVHPEYYVSPHDNVRGKKYPPIQKVLKPGQEVLVQVVKEPAGTKGAFLTTYLSIPGRFLVLTPGREQIGVSRKVDNEAERSRLRDLLGNLDPGPGLGVIVRTVSMGTSEETLQADLQYLKKSWQEIRTKGTTLDSPCLIYQELDLATRSVRDYLNDSISEVWIDDDTAAEPISNMVSMLFPQKNNLVRVYSDAQPLFERYNLQKQLDQIHSREVTLPSGGRLVIDPTEALTAIDINSGRSGGKNNFEDMAYRTNIEAAKMIPLQLRLRDIGGQVVIDFIEMRDKSHWREVEKTLRDSMKIDRARHDIAKISSFGLMEIVRQRLGSSAISISTEPCPHCKGTGIRRNMEWQAQKALREITRSMRLAKDQDQATIVYEADTALAWSLLNHKRQRLCEMEQAFGIILEIRPKSDQP